MSTRKFLTSVADVYAYDNQENLVFTAKTLLDSSIEVSLGSAPVRGGVGNQLQYIYYHTGEMKFTLTDTQWNLAMLGTTVGFTPTSGGNFYEEETVTVTGGSGEVLQTPLAYETGDTVYGWATSPLGVTQKVTFSDKTFTVTGDEQSGEWCVRYYTANLTSGQTVTINANMIPQVLKLVLETQLNSADISTNRIGVVQIIAPTVALSGAFTVSMKADGVSTTPLTGTALAYTPSTSEDACATTPYYAKIVEVIDATYWYSNVLGLAVQGGDFDIENDGTTTLSIWDVPSSGAAWKVSNSLLDFAIDATKLAATEATIGAHTGVFEAGTVAGSALISVNITAASTIDTTVIATVLPA